MCAVLSFESSISDDTGVRAQHAFKWLIAPHNVKEFFSTYFEKKPLLLHHGSAKFSSLFSVDDVKALLLGGQLAYGSEVDVTQYSLKGGRETFNGDFGTKAGKEAWERFSKDGCSIRMLRPQQRHDALWSLCATLESFFECVVGANTYLTPPSSQGFAPHFDDIDAFICQVQGRKRWRVYGPRPDGHDTLPRASSIDFNQEDLVDTPVLIDTVLEPGDMLYLPRGAIHQADCPGSDECADVDKAASLHVTISAYQKWTWADYLINSFTAAIQSAATSNVSLRRTLPHRFTEYIGVSKTERQEEHRQAFDRAVQKAVKTLARAYPIDTGADTLAEHFMRSRLPPPPYLTSSPRRAKRRRTNMAGADKVRATGRGFARVIMGEDSLPRLIHCMDNARDATEAAGDSGMTCLPEEAFAVDFILAAYPRAVRVRDVPLDAAADRVALVEGLQEMRIVTVDEA